MKSSERKKKTEKIRKEILTLFNKSDNLRSNGAKVYLIMKYNEKLSIYNSYPDKEWPPLKIMLVSDVVILIFLIIGRLTVSKRNIIRFQNGASQIISVEKKNREKRNSKQSREISLVNRKSDENILLYEYQNPTDFHRLITSTNVPDGSHLQSEALF
jgi:hypothetical protein